MQSVLMIYLIKLQPEKAEVKFILSYTIELNIFYKIHYQTLT